MPQIIIDIDTTDDSRVPEIADAIEGLLLLLPEQSLVMLDD